MIDSQKMNCVVTESCDDAYDVAQNIDLIPSIVPRTCKDIKRTDLSQPDYFSSLHLYEQIPIIPSNMSANNFTGTNPAGAQHPAASTQPTTTSTSGTKGAEAGEGLKGIFAKGHVSLLSLDLAFLSDTVCRASASPFAATSIAPSMVSLVMTPREQRTSELLVEASRSSSLDSLP